MFPSLYQATRLKKFFVRCPLLLLLFALTAPLSAQEFSFTYDHFALEVSDLKDVGDYYARVLKLREIPHPSEPEGFRWFVIQGNTQLHLIRKDTVPEENRKSEHLCLSTSDLKTFISHLEKLEIPYWDWPGTPGEITLRADGVQQIYLKDPESNWIEINDAPHHRE
ncbi:MAG: VOC family protein [Robiginitalea sp.]|uniref:VOC family protein n=1 Tax=Robiginitalea sp. TaxID=1902411 RepID=UPI003C71D358